MREVAFELRLCAHLEAKPGVVARQLGASVGRGAGRVVDAVRVTPGPEFDERVALTPDTVPPAAIDADCSVAEWRPVTDAFDVRPERARRLAERAAEVGFLEHDRRDGRDVVRRAARYPDWTGDLVGIENKPDLGRPGDLRDQLRRDVSLALFDRVVLATRSHVTGAHRNRIPPEVGIWEVDFDRDDPVEVIREAAPLDAAGPGLQVGERHPGRREVAPVSAAAKARKRRRVAERAYGKGWRTYDFPACERVESATEGDGGALPYCAWKGRLVDPGAECSPDCPGHERADPPAVDPDAERAARTAWDPDPPGAARTQAGLDQF